MYNGMIEAFQTKKVTADCLTDLSFYRRQVAFLRQHVWLAECAEMDALRAYGEKLAQPLFDLMKMNGRFSEDYKRYLASAESDLRMAEENATIEVTMELGYQRAYV